MNQIAYLILDYAKSSNSFRRYNEEASLGSNFLQTHTPELYVSWVFSVDDPAELYSDASEYTQLYVIGDADVMMTTSIEAVKAAETCSPSVKGV